MLLSRFPTAITASLIGLGVLLPATQPWQGWSLPAEPELQPLMVEGQQANPADFSPEELQELQRRFGVHGPQPALAQLFTAGLDQWQPLRRNTLEQIESLVPTIRREARERTLNPMLLGAILYDEIQHAKPGENSPWLAHSGLLQTHGPAQLGVEELIHQGLLPAEPTPEQRQQAREQLLDPQRNVALLAGKMARLSTALGIPSGHLLETSNGYRDAHWIATLAYLHNGKLDYPARILGYMQDPALHALIYGRT
ncbi:MAG: helicase DnaB, partial [Synechococcus sp. H1_metabat_bins_2.tsv.006]|nr:helicase DnaB [Synechococcus sp. H1_metabat_bins_2.tsv.006]